MDQLWQNTDTFSADQPAITVLPNAGSHHSCDHIGPSPCLSHAIYVNLPGGPWGRPAVKQVSTNEESFRTGATGMEKFLQSSLIPSSHSSNTHTGKQNANHQPILSFFPPFLFFPLLFLVPSHWEKLQSLVSLGCSPPDGPGPEWANVCN